MRVLLDTNALLWTLYAPIHLTPKAAEAYASADEVYASVVGPWEIALKLSRGGYHDLNVPKDWEQTLIKQHIILLPIGLRHCRRIQDLPFHHKDPFDRMLIAQALVENLAVIGKDQAFDDYGVKRIW